MVASDTIDPVNYEISVSAMQRICVFCGSSSGSRPTYLAEARRLGVVLAERGIGLVYGGGRVGLMGTVADSVLAAGGEVIGVIPAALATKELAHRDLTDLRVVGSMHERKALMAELADAFIALPGGYGTLEEFFEVLTWSQLGLHAKPCGLLNVDNYYGPLLELIHHAIGEGFVPPEHRALVQVADEPEHLLKLLQAFQPIPVKKWLDRSET